jgi:hypothetical protein
MKKAVIVCLLLTVCFTVVGCDRAVSTEAMLRDFLNAYGIEGTVYSSQKKMHEDGYLSSELLEAIYVIGGDLPDNFALCLNERSAKGFETGFFLCESAVQREEIVEMCRERISLLTENGEEGLLMRSGYLVFYTTAKDKDKAEAVFTKIIKLHY